MKSRNSILTGVLVLVFLFPISTSAPKPNVPAEIEKLFGIWINTSYRAGMGVSYWGWYPQKIKYNPDGTVEAYSAAGDMAHFTGEYTIVEKWTDSEGNTMLKITSNWGDKTYGQTTLYELHRLSSSQPTLEYITSLDDFATKMDPKHPEYHIYFRQEK